MERTPTSTIEEERHAIPFSMTFDTKKFSPAIAEILALDGNGENLPALVCGPCRNPQAKEILSRQNAKELFPGVKDSAAPMAGLWLYFSCFEEAHNLIDDPKSADATFWHAILHRREPDAGNSAYWFRQLGEHPVFKPLAAEAKEILARNPSAEFRIGKWDPFAFISFCERAREQPASVQESAAMEIQRAEWQLLFEYSALGRIESGTASPRAVSQ